ncbi:histidine phosphotransferase [Rhodobacter sp. TJ_12]|uniref:histidine phosphotransferase family protein n=1 Tax=Rhodobacter sp. TJ_12 TaxID=2029399 RepID=UPI001CBC8DF7|nr:histidine phosphotransferase family protein [Rhodobacter sp. TJ_12]MBZ4021450.1 histidine phosphotransferase [Rhodobacter sp. TJ_12]
MPHDTTTIPAPTVDDTLLDADLVALVGSRLCHDLISPLGAIGNGVELLGMSGLGSSPEVQLISESVAAANARIKFFRVAFGQANADQQLGTQEILTVLEEISRGGRLQYHWLGAGDQPRRLVKLIFLGLLCLEPALPWGGEVVIREEGGEWRLSAQTKRTKPDPELWSRLTGSLVPVSPAQVQFALLPREAGHQGRRVSWELTETSAEIVF